MSGSMGVHALVTGRVQGVGFRWHSRKKAESLGLDGWVRNLLDGRVEVFFCGSTESVAAMKAYLARGPLAARVDNLECRESRDSVEGGFVIKETVAKEDHA